MRIGLIGSVLREIAVLAGRAILQSSAGNGFTRMTDHARRAWRAVQTTTSWEPRSSSRQVSTNNRAVAGDRSANRVKA
jgi:hypothetical protein